MASEQYVIIPGTQKKVYEGSVVMLHRLPNLRWIIHHGFYSYNGKRQKGWYFSSIPSDTTMPVFNEDLVAMTVIDGQSEDYPPAPPGPGPIPPGPVPPVPPGPPAPVPVPFTPQDKKQLDSATITVDTLADRDKLGSAGLPDGKVVKVNNYDGEGSIEYYSWNAETEMWEEASLGYRFMTRKEIADAIARDIVEIVWSNEKGALVLTNNGGTTLDPVKLSGLAHNPLYNDSEVLVIPIYGSEDLEISIPISAINDQINALRDRITFGPGPDNEILVTSDDSLNRSGYKIGGAELDTESDSTVATEAAVTKAMSWNEF